MENRAVYGAKRNIEDFQRESETISQFLNGIAGIGKAMHGTKHDTGKPDLSLVPRGLVDGCARAMMFGVGKYGRDNWRSGFQDSRLLAACLRHVFAYCDGERTDEESGLSHLDHAAFSLAVVMDQLRQRKDGDDVGDDDLPVKGGC